jgi:uncharacterized membrane protein
MMNTMTTEYRQHMQTRQDSPVELTSPVIWLREGWNDFMASPVISLLIGGAFTLLCLSAYAAISISPILSATMLALMLLASPFFAATAYSVARQQEQSGSAHLRAALHEMRVRALGIGVFSVLSALIVGAWVRLSSIVFAIYYGSLEVNNAAELARAWTAGFDYPGMLLFMLITGAALGLTLFVIGALALPMIAEKDSDIITAMANSISRLSEHSLTMFVWISLILGTVSLALLSGLLLMPVIFPILAYASWHSYKHMGSK